MKPIHITMGVVVAGIAGFLIGRYMTKSAQPTGAVKFAGFTQDTSDNSMNASGGGQRTFGSDKGSGRIVKGRGGKIFDTANPHLGYH